MDHRSLPDRMQAALLAARQAGIAPAVTALRTTLAAFSNAEASPAPRTSSSNPPVVGRLVEHERLLLTTSDHERILREQIAVRSQAAEDYYGLGQHDAAATLRAELDVLEAHLASG